MTGMEAGWYRDPAPPNPAFPTTLRYWDGTGWTEQVKAASKREREAWHHDLAQARADRAAEAWEQAVATGTVTAEQLDAATGRYATPDGQPLSGWWRRAGAVLVDSLLTSVVGLGIGWPWVSRIWHAYTGFVQLAVDSSRTGGALPDTAAFRESIAGPLLTVGLVFWGVQLVYGVGFLKAFAATPGKMLLGIEVRLRATPGVLSWRTVLTRWFAQYFGALLRLAPGVGLPGSFYGLLDSLWPLWDGRRQALHDRVARTNVVRRAR